MAGTYISTRPVRRYGPFTCLHCGKEYHAKAVDRNKYCGRECAFEGQRVSRAIAKAERDVPRLLAIERNRLIRRMLCLMRGLARERQANQLKYTKATTPCAVCGGPCGYTFGRARKYCSHACLAKSPAYIKAKRVYRSQRRAKERGRYADDIDPIKVFERDSWRCHICAKKLKPSDRGTYKPVAPELDHIIALADGGTHTHGNVACSCRACNLAKGSMSFGQLSLGIAA